MGWNWDGRRGKYLEKCGFHAFEFGMSPDGTRVDLATGDDDVVDGVTPKQAQQIIAYLRRLEERVQAHIELHYEDK